MTSPGSTTPRASPSLLFAIGDGNHSLAAAKAAYEEKKQHTPQEQWADLPSRYALVELVNLHDESLEFEPIHRVNASTWMRNRADE